eukprot:6202999-Pleurochrysis_carterae.AAC.1
MRLHLARDASPCQDGCRQAAGADAGAVGMAAHGLVDRHGAPIEPPEQKRKLLFAWWADIALL